MGDCVVEWSWWLWKFGKLFKFFINFCKILYNLYKMCCFCRKWWYNTEINFQNSKNMLK